MTNNTSKSVNLYAYGYGEAKTYVAAVLFVLGNIALPQLFHLVPKGGMIWLPIYFFTLVGAYKYGWRVGLLTAVASPLVNSAMFGMPMATALPAILTKLVLLAVAAGFAASHYRKVSLPLLIGVVAFYQLVGSLVEWAIITGRGGALAPGTTALSAALQDLRIGLPGMALQILGGYAFIKYIIRK